MPGTLVRKMLVPGAAGLLPLTRRDYETSDCPECLTRQRDAAMVNKVARRHIQRCKLLIRLIAVALTAGVFRWFGSKATIESYSATVYYNGIYWNDFELTRRYINTLATDDPSKDWQQHLFDWNDRRPFKKALILNCGNGFVERDLFNKGFIQSAVGVDINEDLLKVARSHTRSGHYPFRYLKRDSNANNDFGSSDFDLVVNHAALHHIAYIDQHVRGLAKLLQKSGGILVNFDFIGPHRNQYPDVQWNAMLELNSRSDPCFRHPRLKYPHLPTMLSTDPSEAVHSELIVDTLTRYFEPIWLRFLHGSLAYELLTHNSNLQPSTCRSTLNISQHIEWVLKEDHLYATKHAGSSLFMYSIMKTKKQSPTKADLRTWNVEELRREKRAQKRGGIYYDLTKSHIQEYGEQPA